MSWDARFEALEWLSYPSQLQECHLSHPAVLMQANPIAFVGEELLALLCLPVRCCLLVIKAWQAFLLLLLLPLNVCTEELVMQARSIGSCSVLAVLY